MTTIPPIVSIDELVEYPDAVLADVRWYLDGRSGRAAYEAGHLERFRVSVGSLTPQLSCKGTI